MAKIASENVIDGRSHFQQRANAIATPYAERLSQTARVPVADRPIMAANLGGLAARIDPISPLAGAKSMIEKSGHEGLWQKRKRFIRLPAEPASQFSEWGVYGSSGATYLQLANAAGKLLSANHPQGIEAEQERCIRALLNGTSFLPNFAPLTKSDQTAKGLLDEYAAVVVERVKQRTRIVELWEVMRESPFGLEARFDDDPPFEFSFGDAAKFPNSLLQPIFREGVTEAVFRPARDPYGWEEPTVQLGYVAIPVQTRMFALPAHVGRNFFALEDDEDSELSRDALNWLGSISDGGEGLTEMEFDEAHGYGWKPATLVMLRPVGLTIFRGDAEEPSIRLSIWGSDGVAAYKAGQGSHQFEQSIIESNGEATQLISVDYYEDTYSSYYAVLSHPVRYEDVSKAEILGLVSPTWNYDSKFFDLEGTAWSDDPTTAALLFGSGARFIPTMALCEPVAGPLPSGSVGAGLLNNALTATDPQRISTQLIQKARETADAGLRFHEAMVDEYREALRNI